MKTYRIKVLQGDDGWLVAEGINLRGLITQGRDLNELTAMIRDAIELLTESSEFTIQLLVPSSIKMASPKTTTKRRRPKAA